MNNIFGDNRPREHLRLIPEIEKSQRLQAFVETLLGRFILSILFLLVLYSFGHDRTYFQFSWLEIFAIFWLGVFPGPILPKLFVGILLTYFSGPRRYLGLMVTQNDQLDFAHDLFFKFNERIADKPFFYNGAALAFFCFLTWICLRGLRWLKPQIPALWLFLVWVSLMTLAINLPPGTVWSSVVWLTVGTFSVCLFSIAYFHTAKSNSTFFYWSTFSLQTVLLAPPFTVIRHPSLLTGKMPRSVCQLKALKLIVWTRFLAFIANEINHILFIKWRWAHFNSIGIAQYNALHLGWHQVLVTRLCQTLLFLLNLSVTTGVGISIFRLAGVYLPRAICRPYVARSFNEYFRRCLFYYSETIVHLFFYPIYIKIQTLVENRKWRMQISLFVSLFIGGWIFHVVIAWQSFFFFGPEPSLENAFGWLPYFALVALACCLSATGWLSRKLRSAPLALHFSLNVFTHMFLMCFFQYSLGETFEGRINWIRSMWPI
jgi:hypothetical protein